MRRKTNTKSMREYLSEYPTCFVCGRLGEVHHILLKSLGGKDEPANYITLCRYHHNVAHGIIPGVKRFSREELWALKKRVEEQK